MIFTERLAEAVDTALDRSVVLGYTKIGSALRKSWWPDDPDRATLAGQRVVVTGATSGIGEAMARSFAELGAIVHLVGRNEAKVKTSAGSIRGAVAGAQVIEEVCDVSDLDAVRAWTADLSARVPSLRGLVHNAGAMPPDRAESPQGHEVQLATHVLGPHLMTEQLLPLLAAAHGASVVWMSSGGMYTTPLVADDIEFRDGYSGAKAYARTKRMQVVLADAWARRLADTDIAVESMHPGWVSTPGVSQYLPLFDKITSPLLRDATDGADTAVWLVATRPDSTPGHFWHDRAQRPTTFGWQRAQDPAKVQYLLQQVCTLTDTPVDWIASRH
ncbi:MAG: SDR family NAD(P)-dependent oxidoreductase [Mycobacterium sp.]